MLAVSWDTVRLFLHVLAATVWVGGQLTLAALVPVLRQSPLICTLAIRPPATSMSAATSLPPGGLYSPCMAG